MWVYHPIHSAVRRSVSCNVSAAVSRQNCGVTSTGDRQQKAALLFVAPQTQALLRGNTPIITNGSVSRAPLCGATKKVLSFPMFR